MAIKKRLTKYLLLKTRINLCFKMLFNPDIIIYDPSTEAITRIFGKKMIEKLRDQRDLYLVFVFCDLDCLKEVNDNYGHRTGDMFLKKFTEAVKMNIRKGDLIIRFGGDEFLITFTFSLKDNKNKSFEKISKKEEIGKTIDTIMKRISKDFPFFSYGYAFDDKRKTIDEVIDLANKRMYEQKKNKNRNENLERIKKFIKIKNVDKTLSHIS